MSFTGNEDHSISLIDASALTANYRNTHSASAIKGFFYGKTAISDILAQDDCVGIRIYFGEDDEGNPQLVICGADANEDDLDQGILAELGKPCPPRCGITNTLNS